MSQERSKLDKEFKLVTMELNQNPRESKWTG
jgi:hypothetical protein